MCAFSHGSDEHASFVVRAVSSKSFNISQPKHAQEPIQRPVIAFSQISV